MTEKGSCYLQGYRYAPPLPAEQFIAEWVYNLSLIHIYHTMKIITRGEAMRIHQQQPASRLFPFCTGKYRWHCLLYTSRCV